MPVSMILQQLHVSLQQWWFNTLHTVVYTCVSRLHRNRQPITGCHTLLFSLLISQTDTPAVTELHPGNCMATIYSHHKHLNSLIMIRVESTLQMSYNVTVP